MPAYEFVFERGTVTVPEWVVDLPSFCRWADEAYGFEFARVGWLNGTIRIDVSLEELYTHNRVKAAVMTTLATLVRAEDRGHYFTSGVFLCNVAADLACQPDGVFVSYAATGDNRCRVMTSRHGEPNGLEGTPDLVLEIVGDGSETHDTRRLRQAYWQAGIPEYWLIDARQTPLTFDLLRATAGAYVAAIPADGWVRSDVLGREFRLTVEPDPRGQPDYTLELR